MKVEKILKKGNSFVAYNDKNESMGRISIKTEKFVGNTDALIPLSEHLDAHFKSDKTTKMINKKYWYARVNVSVPILKKIKYPGFVLDIGALIINSDKRNLVLDTSSTEFKNPQRKGSNLTLEARLDIDFDTFPVNEDNNYCVTIADVLAKNFTGSLFLSDQDMDDDDGEFDFTNAKATVTFYDLCGETITKEIELEQ